MTTLCPQDFIIIPGKQYKVKDTKMETKVKDQKKSTSNQQYGRLSQKPKTICKPENEAKLEPIQVLNSIVFPCLTLFSLQFH